MVAQGGETLRLGFERPAAPAWYLYYLRGLANGRLAEMPIDQALREPLRLEECGVAGPLVDLVKLEDITADVIALMKSEDILDRVLVWAAPHYPRLAGAGRRGRGLARR